MLKKNTSTSRQVEDERFLFTRMPSFLKSEDPLIKPDKYVNKSQASYIICTSCDNTIAKITRIIIWGRCRRSVRIFENLT